MSAEENRALVRRYFDLLSGNKPSTAEEILSPEQYAGWLTGRVHTYPGYPCRCDPPVR